MTLLCPLSGCDVDRVIRTDCDTLVIVANHRRDRGRCRDCGTLSSAVHSCYDRHLADLPSFRRAVRLCLACGALVANDESRPKRRILYEVPFPHSSLRRALRLLIGRCQ